MDDIKINEVGTVSVANTSRGTDKPTFVNPNNVTFKVEYPKDHKGPKHMPEGEVVVSKESADHFTSLGIGSVVEADAEDNGKKKKSR